MHYIFGDSGSAALHSGLARSHTLSAPSLRSLGRQIYRYAKQKSKNGAAMRRLARKVKRWKGLPATGYEAPITMRRPRTAIHDVAVAADHRPTEAMIRK